MDWQGIATLVSAIGVIILGIVVPIINSKQKRKEKEWDLEIDRRFDKIKKDEDIERAKLSETYSKLYAYMWKLLFAVDADRVFIIQPHPMVDRQYISVSLEITHPDRDVATHKENFQFKRMSEWAGLVAKIGNEDWMVYRDVMEIKDNKIFSEAHRRGVQTLLYRRLKDESGYWEGNLCIEYTHNRPENLDYIKEKIVNTARLVEDILPEYQPLQA